MDMEAPDVGASRLGEVYELGSRFIPPQKADAGEAKTEEEGGKDTAQFHQS